MNSVISLNKNVLNDAMEKDKLGNDDIYSIFGIPILLKDNIGFESLPTTAGAYSLKDNYTEDAFITKKLKSEGFANARLAGKSRSGLLRVSYGSYPKKLLALKALAKAKLSHNVNAWLAED